LEEEESEELQKKIPSFPYLKVYLAYAELRKPLAALFIQNGELEALKPHHEVFFHSSPVLKVFQVKNLYHCEWLVSIRGYFCVPSFS